MNQEAYPTSQDNDAEDGTTLNHVGGGWVFGEECRANERSRQAGESAFGEAIESDRWAEAWRDKDLAEAAGLRAEADRLETRGVQPMNRQKLVDGQWAPVSEEAELVARHEGLTKLVARLRADAEWLEAKGGRP